MTSITFFAAGTPKGQPRVKAFSRGKHAGVYDPGTADEWKMIVRHEAHKHAPEKVLFDPIQLTLFFYFKRPESHYKTVKGNRILKDTAPFYHTGKPDADNLAKAVMDAITNLGSIWHDDAQVAALDIRKFYCATEQAPGCDVIISAKNMQ